MKYYKIKSEYANKQRLKWSKQKHIYIPDSIWIANELYTQSELINNRYKTAPEMFDEIEIRKTDTYFFFGARFQKDTPTPNTKRENPNPDKQRAETFLNAADIVCGECPATVCDSCPVRKLCDHFNQYQ